MLDLYRLRLRATFLGAVRRFFDRQEFLEVDTPLRLPVIIPETHIVPVEADGLYLQASPELCMKQLLAGGAERIYQICSGFRKGERGRLHSEEFRILEWYRRRADYFQLMEDCERLVGAVAASLADPPELIPFAGLSLAGSWQRLSVAEAFARYSPTTLEESLERGIFEQMLVEHIEPCLGRKRPLFLYDYPVSLGSLARISRTDSRWVERFELYMDGIEIANGFSELYDPREQRARFATEIERISALYGREMAMPEGFLSQLAKMGPAAGIALGLDRLFMLAINKTRLKAAQSFCLEEDF
ncbi:MAG: EF-P lysine aminoacylase GenX [Deltaproteobacteria bacterium]|nr:MAG: EF-P lysine aminoacylase GenX [Deltaproteobacteria bacterium]